MILLLTVGESWLFIYLSNSFMEFLDANGANFRFAAGWLLKFLIYVGQVAFLAAVALALLPHNVNSKRTALYISLAIVSVFWFVQKVPGYGVATCLRAMFSVEPQGLGITAMIQSVWESLFLIMVFETICRADNSRRTAFALFVAMECWFIIEALIRLLWDVYEIRLYDIVIVGLRIGIMILFTIVWNRYVGPGSLNRSDRLAAPASVE